MTKEVDEEIFPNERWKPNHRWRLILFRILN